MLRKTLITLFVLSASLLFAKSIIAVPAQSAGNEEIFEALVTKIIDEQTITRENNQQSIQQNLLLTGSSGQWLGQEILYQGISKIDVLNHNYYHQGDRVLVQKSVAPDSPDQFYIIDFIRRSPLYWLTALFVIIIIIIGRFKGVKSLVGLVISFLIIIKIMLPLILAGGNPLLIGTIGSLAILAVIIYLTEGINRKSHLALIGVLLSLLVTMGLSVLFTNWTRLTGLAQEETAFLITLGQNIINFKGLLLAGMLIGAVGVLDDVIVGQIEATRQIKKANPKLSSGQVFSLAYKVGNTHLGAIVNTLFLTYAGASLPLLLLFVVKQEPFMSFNQIINNEIIATEIVRTLVGSIGVAMSMPIATFLGSYFLKNKSSNHQQYVKN